MLPDIKYNVIIYFARAVHELYFCVIQLNFRHKMQYFEMRTLNENCIIRTNVYLQAK